MSLFGGPITLKLRLVTKQNHNVVLGEETVQTNADGKIPIKKLEQKWNLQPNRFCNYLLFHKIFI